MRWLLVVLLLLMQTAIPVQAVAPTPESGILEDPQGDVIIDVYGAGEAPADPNMNNMDLRWLSWEEQEDTVFFTVAVQNLDETVQGVSHTAGDIRIHFSYGDKPYYVQTGVSAQGQSYARLFESFGGLNGRMIEILDHEVVRTDATIKVWVPREHILDVNGAPMIRGREVHDISVRAYHFVGFGFIDPLTQEEDEFFVIRDFMPDDLVGTEVMVQMGGIVQNGPVNLEAPAPFRASNGGAGRFEFRATLFNEGETKADYEVELSGIPGMWDVYLPQMPISVPAGGNVTFQVFIETPDQHQHGGNSQFVMNVFNVDDSDVYAAMDMGIYYLDVPQPAGHHSTLYLHTRADGDASNPFALFAQTLGFSDFQEGYLNTLDPINDEADTGAPLAPMDLAFGPAADFRWGMCLEPRLLLGLDMNLTEVGKATLGFSAGIDFQDVKIEGRLVRLLPQDDVPEGNDGPRRGGRNDELPCEFATFSDRSDLTVASFSAEGLTIGSAKKLVEMDLVPGPDADYLPYVEGSDLVLEIRMTTSTPYIVGQIQPMLEPGGNLLLPIDEYYDERPAGLVGSAEEILEDLGEDVDVAVEETLTTEVQKAPGPFLLVLVGLAALVVVRRRK